GGLVAELDRRRHELMDIRLQARRHALGAALTGVGLLASAAGFVWLGAWRARRRRTAMARLGRLRKAVSRMVERPERVATERRIPAKNLTTAASAPAGAAIQKGLGGGLPGAPGSSASSSPASP